MNTRSLRIWTLAISALLISALIIVFLPYFSASEKVVSKANLSKSEAKPELTEKKDSYQEVVVIIYTDLQCSACAAANNSFNAIEADYRDRVRFEYRHFPMPQHENAANAALAVEAAAQQGKAGEMRNRLFETRSQWAKSKVPTIHFNALAIGLQLDLSQFQSDMQNPKTLEKVVSDFQTGFLSGVRATPSAVIDGTLLILKNEDQFRAKIDEAINEEQ